MSRTVWHGPLAAWAGALSLCAASPAWAGRDCESRAPTVQAVTQGLALAERVQLQLDRSGADVVVLARMGQDLSRHGLRYSHLGLAHRQGGMWRVLHKLNACGSARSAVFREGLGHFFLDDPHEYEAAVLPLTPAVSERLLPLLLAPEALRPLHEARYSMLSHAWSQQYQQSNQWAIEVLAHAMQLPPQPAQRARSQRWLQQAGYRPAEIHLAAWTRLGARLTAANVAFDDHPLGLRVAGRFRTVTVESVFAWLQASGHGGPMFVVR